MNRDELMAMYDFAGKTFAVTGGAGALGGDVVVALAGCGASVMILDLRLGGVPAIKERLGERASQVDACEVNVLSRDSLTAAGTAINERFGPLYGLGATVEFGPLVKGALDMVMDLLYEA